MAVVVVGSYNHDLIFNTHDHLPHEGETCMGDFASAHGGKGFNQAVAARRLGAETQFIGALGDDEYAERARKFAEAESIECHWQIFEGLRTGLASVTTDDQGHNLIVVAPGANNAMTTDHLEQNQAAFEGADVVLTQLEINLETASQAMTMAREHRATAILNPAPVNSAASKELLQKADILTPNRNEFAFMMNHLFGVSLEKEWDSRNDMKLHEICRETGIDTVIITLGEKGCFVSHDDDSRYAPEITSYRVFGIETQAVDTTGAGDAFSGALAVALSKGERFRDALNFANKAAAFSVTKRGAAPSMPRPEDLA